MFEWNSVDLAAEVAKLKAAAPKGTYPKGASDMEIAATKNLQYFNGKVRRRYLAPDVIEQNLQQYKADWVDGLKGFDPTSGTNVMNSDFSDTLLQFQKMAAAGYLSGMFNLSSAHAKQPT
jgi:hypothetical protein